MSREIRVKLMQSLYGAIIVGNNIEIVLFGACKVNVLKQEVSVLKERLSDAQIDSIEKLGDEKRRIEEEQIPLANRSKNSSPSHNNNPRRCRRLVHSSTKATWNSTERNANFAKKVLQSKIIPQFRRRERGIT